MDANKIMNEEIVEAGQLIDLLHSLKREGYSQLTDMTAVDFYPETPRFTLVIHLLNMDDNKRICVKIKLKEGEQVASFHSVFANSTWYEREVFDMFGIEFADGVDGRRILTDYDFEDHPLRKDFPMSGEYELFYDTEKKECAYRKVVK